jgi:Family of unknown function (DUF6454)
MKIPRFCTFLSLATLFLYLVARGQTYFTWSWGDVKLLRSLPLTGKTFHVQGIDTDGVHLWVSSVDSEAKKGFLHKFDFETGALLEAVELQDGERFHPGGIALDGNSLWVPVAEYRASSTTVVRRLNKNTMKEDFRFDVQDHIGCIVATPQYLIGGNWDAKDFYVWDHSGKLLSKVPNSSQNAYQDLKFDGSHVIASGLLSDKSGAIDWLQFPTLRLEHRLKAPNTDRGVPFTQEGMAVYNDELLLLPEDGPSRLFVFSLTGGNK